MFVKNTWYPALWSKDLPGGRLRAMRLLDEPVVMFRQEDGTAVAMSDACPHRQAPLHMGRLLSGNRVQCGYHGLEFAADGRCVLNPHGEGKVSGAMRTRTFTVEERHTLIWIWMGDRPADTALIPDFSLMDERDDGMARARDSIRLEAGYLLLADNLLDLSHANFLHEGILGFPEHGNAEVITEQEGDNIRVRRWMPNVPIARLHDLMFKRDGKPIDMWNEVWWTAPGCLKLTHGFSRPGESKQAPFEFTAVHLLMPETPTSTSYHYGIVRTPAPDEPELRQAVADTRRHVFEEQDRVILEAQQRMQNEPALAGVKPVMFSVDAASMRMRRLIDAMLATEMASAR